jgi:hypothetical protein
VLIYEDLEDGTELEWHEMELARSQVTELTKPKEHLHAFNPTDFEE